jgi:serine/threonine protein kinase
MLAAFLLWLCRATSFVGTAEYVSPEVLNNAGISYTADLWALGCIVYQMLTGRPPFKGASEYLTFQLITSRSLSFPQGFPAAARDLVEGLLQLEPSQRLGGWTSWEFCCVRLLCRQLLQLEPSQRLGGLVVCGCGCGCSGALGV